MNCRRITALLLILMLTACATPYSLVEPGEATIGGMKVTADGAWNSASAMQAPYAQKYSQVWTQDGLLLDRLMIFGGVSDGEALFKIASKDAALPVFRSDMLPNEVAELVESSIVKILGEGEVAVSTSKLRPQLFADQRGAMFDLSAKLSDGPGYSGMAGGFVASDKLYLVIFLGAEPYYNEKHRDVAEAIIKSARL